jgi:hypothetical protein
MAQSQLIDDGLMERLEDLERRVMALEKKLKSVNLVLFGGSTSATTSGRLAGLVVIQNAGFCYI